jgi:hypothetical protein
MTDVTDLSPGSTLRAEATGWKYRVVSEGAKVRLDGPRGPVVVSREELQTDIARGKISVIA